MAEGNSAFPLFGPQWFAGSAHSGNEQSRPNQDQVERIYLQLYDMFVDCIDPSVIQEVAVSRKWNINEAINDLVMLTSNDCRKQDSSEQCLSEIPNQPVARSPPGDSKGTCKTINKKSNVETVSNIAGFPDLIDLNPQPKLSEVKVSYNQEPGDDDDADVIIVKGNEFLPQSMEQRTFSQQSSVGNAATLTSTRPQCFVQLMPELLIGNKNVEIGNKNFETKTVKKAVIQKETQNKNCPAKTDTSVRREYALIKKQPDSINRIVLLIKNNIKVMVLMRGCPGSGKTYLSKLLLQRVQIKSELYDKFIFSADNYFYQRGVYVFNPEYLGDAHALTQQCVLSAAAESRNPIIIDNTNTQVWEMKAYAKIGVQYGYDLEILEPNTSWAFKERELARKNVHDVPKSKIRIMLDRYELNITPRKLLSQLNLYYPPGSEPPQLAAKKSVKQTNSGKKKKSAKKSEKSEEKAKLRKNKSSLFDTKKPLDYSNILDVNAVPELIPLIKNINKQWEEIGGISSDNNNENIISEGATNSTCLYNIFDKEDASSSADNQSSSESESLNTFDNLQNTTTVTDEITKFTDRNHDSDLINDSNLINDSSDLFLFVDGNNILKNERKEENILNILDSECAFEDNMHYDFSKKSASTDNDKMLLKTYDLQTCDETESVNVCSKYSFDAEALSKHVQPVENVSYYNNSLVEYKRCVSDAKLMIEDISLSNNGEADSMNKPCTRYSFTKETLAEHVHEVMDIDCCNALVEYKNSTVDLINLWSKYQTNENRVENRNDMNTIICNGNSHCLRDSSDENLLLDFVLINDSVHTNHSGIVETENDFSLLQNVGTNESERKLSDLNLLSLQQCEDSECLSFNQENWKHDTVLEENSNLCSTEVVDKTRCFTTDLISEVLEQQNRNEELVDKVSSQNLGTSEINLIVNGSQLFENRIVQREDYNSFNADSNKTVNTDANQNESQKSNEIVNVNENLYETKCECYSNKSIHVEDRASNVQKLDCVDFSTGNVKASGDLGQYYNKSQNTNEEVDNSNSDCLFLGAKSHCHEENAVGLEDNQNVKKITEETLGNDGFLIANDCTFTNEMPETSDASINSNSICKENIKNYENEGNCVNVDDSGMRNNWKFTLVEYLLNKQLENNDLSNYNSTIDTVNKESELLQNLSSNTAKDSCEIVTEELLDPILEGKPIQNFDLLAYLFEKNVKKGAVNVDESQEDKNCLHTADENKHERDNGAAVEDCVLEEWERQGDSWDDTNNKEMEENVSIEADATIPKPARNPTKFRVRNICDSPINLIENISDSCDWDTIDNPSFNWNSADAVQKIENSTEVMPQDQREYKPKAVTIDQSTNTCYTDFNLLHCDNSDETIKEKILFSKNRNICEGRSPSVNVYKPNFLMFDKSTMTGDDLVCETKLKYDFQQLVEMFPETELGSLMELVDRCDGNLDWAADVLADSERNAQLSVNNSFDKHSGVPLEMFGTFKESSFVQAGEPTADALVFGVPSQSMRLKKSNKQEKKNASESQLELKKQIESSFVLDKSHYSEHVWKIKKKRNGDFVKRDNVSDIEDMYLQEAEAEFSDFLNTKSDTEDESSNDDDEYYEDDEDVSDNAEDTFDNDVEEDGNITGEEEQLLSDAEAEDEEGTLKLTLDWSLITQLQNTFGNPLPDMKDLKPEVELPLSLACQLYSYVVESLIHQLEQQQEAIDKMIAEDNAFAWQLQQQEEEEASTSVQQPVPNLQEIMDMEMALALYRADQEDWKQQSQDSMADILSKKLLLEKFPQVDCNVLVEMFHAHNCSLHDTVTTLSMSLAVDEPGLVEREKELLANAEEEKIKIQKSKSETVFTYGPEHRSHKQMLALKEEAGNMRTQASRYYELRKECFTKAQDMYKSGNRSVASYYSHLAELYKEKIELCNSQAAACMLYARTNSRTLDLHFLRVAEAEIVLKLFLDESIVQLREKQKTKEMLIVITGRGLHSADGVPRIREMVKSRLRKRKIRFCEENPGLLRAVITRNTQLSQQ